MGRYLTDRYRDRLHGTLSCYDRMVVTGTLPQVCYAQGMTAFLKARGIRIFDYPRFAEPLRDAIRSRAREVAEAAGLDIEHIAHPQGGCRGQGAQASRRSSRTGARDLGDGGLRQL
jgi:hypothetical protein